MIKHVKRFLCFLLLLVAVAPQKVCAQPQPTLTVTTTVIPISSLSISDIDFVNSTSPRWLFTVLLRTGEPLPIDVRIQLRLTARLANGENLGEIASLRTAWLPVTGLRSITNVDLRNPDLRETDVVWDEVKRDRLRDLALPSGRLPAGVYGFVVTAEAADGRTVVCANCSPDLEIRNTGSLELLSPRDDETTTLLPLFQWRGDFPRWTIAVFERLPGQSSYEEAASGVPMLEQVVDGGALSFQYPQSDARPLRPGGTYVWYVEGRANASASSPGTLRSPLRSFTVATGAAGSTSSVLDELERALGPRYRALFDRIRSEGLTSSGTIRLNGSVITLPELLAILSTLRTSPDAVTAVELD
jgi:hypothetical protein